MNILLAPDKFKGSISAQGVCNALTNGMLRANPDLNLISRPLADGGEGSLEILGHYLDLKTYSLEVADPLGRPILASYKRAEDTAYIELSSASGLELLTPEERNCMYTSSFGTGQLMADALSKGVREIFLFIGGSATNDGGTGIAKALGYQFYDAYGSLLEPKGENLRDIVRMDESQFSVKRNAFSLKVICDVNNPFYGKKGAAYVYAAQKGANPAEIVLLDQGLENLAKCFVYQGYPDIAQVPGAGAAGGVGGGCLALLGGKLISGIQTFLEIADLEALIKTSDLVITGEGKIDRQTAHGKVVSGVSTLAKKYGVPLIAVCGMAEEQAAETLAIGEVYSVVERVNSLEEAISKVDEKLAEIGWEIILSLE